MQLKHFLSLAAVTSLASSTALPRCVNDSCQKAVKNAGNQGWWDCYFARRVTTTPAPYTAWSTISRTVSTTSTVTTTVETDTTTTLSFTETSTSTVTENPTTTVSTTSTIQPWAGQGGARRRMPDPLPTADSDLAARGALGHFPLSVAVAAETGSVDKRAARPLGHFPLAALPDPEESEDLSKRGLPIPRSCGTQSKYISACACNGVPQATVTAPRKTIQSKTTTTITSSFTSTSTQTNTITIRESVTSTVTATTTTTITSTETYSTSVLASPTCTSFSKGPQPQWQYRYNLEYAGFFTLNDQSPANNPGAPPITQTLPGTQSACEAAENCIAWAATTFSPMGGGAYFTTNLRFRPDSTDWLCVAYYDQTPASYYNVNSPGVSQSFGWTKRP